MPGPVTTRRRFFAQALAAVPASTLLAAEPTTPVAEPRLKEACDRRTKAAELQSKRKLAPLIANGDEEKLPSRIGCFKKGLPQNQYAEAEPGAYNALLTAVKSGKFEDFEKIPRGGGRKLSNPQAVSTFHLEGGDPHTFDVPPAPSIAHADMAADSDELYWQSLCRDIPFADYETSPLIQKAAKHLGVTPATIFRGPMPGCLKGPYVSQFLYKPIPFGSAHIDQHYEVPLPGNDFMTAENEWAQMQAGFLPWRGVAYDPVYRYTRTGRDLSEYVHYDFAYQAHMSAALILINANARSILNCNQFKSGNNPYRYSTIEEGFVTFGMAEAADWIGRVTTAALKAAYYQKWAIHRRVRPEELGGLIHLTRTGSRKYPIHKSLLHSEAVEAVHAKTGSYLLPQAYPEGCPMHPSYPSGHAAIAGACAVVLKVCFDGSMLLPGCIQPAENGTKVVPCENYFPTLNDEIDKLAFNIAVGRGWAGIHYHSDHMTGLTMGEAVGISVMQDMVRTYSESFKGLSLRKFDGTDITINPDGSIVNR